MTEGTERRCAECGQPLIENPEGDHAWFVVSGVGLVCSNACALKASRLPEKFWTLSLGDVDVG
jgi:uncharacterized protein (DUF983 family)